METLRIETEGGVIVAPDWKAVAQLNKKLADLAATLGPVTKDGTNPHFKYKYVSYESLALTIREALTAHGLAFSIATYLQEELEHNRMAVGMEGQFTDTETGAVKAILWHGEGGDTQDKATAMAQTAGTKYFLMRNFLVSEEGDVDSDKDAPTRREKQPDKPKRGPVYGPDSGQGSQLTDEAIDKLKIRAKEILGADVFNTEVRDQVYAILGVSSMAEWKGSYQDAVDKLQASGGRETGDADAIRARILENYRPEWTRDPSDKQIGFANGLAHSLFDGEDKQAQSMMVATLFDSIFNLTGEGKELKATSLTGHQCSLFIEWAKSPDSGDIRPDAVQEAYALVESLEAEAGQGRIF